MWLCDVLFDCILHWIVSFIANRSRAGCCSSCLGALGPSRQYFIILRLCFLTCPHRSFLWKLSCPSLFIISFSSSGTSRSLSRCICHLRCRNGPKIPEPKSHCKTLVVLPMSPFLEQIDLPWLKSTCLYCFFWLPRFMICILRIPRTCTGFSTQIPNVDGCLSEILLFLTSELKAHWSLKVLVSFGWTHFHTFLESTAFLRFLSWFWFPIRLILVKCRVCILSKFCFPASEFHELCMV